MKERIMLGISVFGKPSEAVQTLLTFWSVLALKYEVVIGIVTELRELPEEVNGALRSLRQTGAKILVWNKVTTQRLLEHLPEGLPRPCYSGYSYGQIPNLLRILAHCAGCEFLFRVDATVLALLDPLPFVERAMRVLRNGSMLTVSADYSHRKGIRHDFIPDQRKEEFFALIQNTMGIDPHKQVLGGALMAFGRQTPPAIVLDGVMAVYSDDAFYQLDCGERARPLSEFKVYRADPGHQMASAEYFVRLSSAVMLVGLKQGGSEDSAFEGTRGFLQRLCELVSPELRDVVGGINVHEAIKPWRFHEAIANHQALKDRWAEVVVAAADPVQGSGLDFEPCDLPGSAPPARGQAGRPTLRGAEDGAKY